MGPTAVEQAIKRRMLPHATTKSGQLAGHNRLREHVVAVLAGRGLAWPDEACADVAEGLLVDMMAFAGRGWLGPLPPGA